MRIYAFALLVVEGTSILCQEQSKNFVNQFKKKAIRTQGYLDLAQEVTQTTSIAPECESKFCDFTFSVLKKESEGSPVTRLASLFRKWIKPIPQGSVCLKLRHEWMLTTISNDESINVRFLMCMDKAVDLRANRSLRQPIREYFDSLETHLSYYPGNKCLANNCLLVAKLASMEGDDSGKQDKVDSIMRQLPVAQASQGLTRQSSEFLCAVMNDVEDESKDFDALVTDFYQWKCLTKARTFFGSEDRTVKTIFDALASYFAGNKMSIRLDKMCETAFWAVSLTEIDQNAKETIVSKALANSEPPRKPLKKGQKLPTPSTDHIKRYVNALSAALGYYVSPRVDNIFAKSEAVEVIESVLDYPNRSLIDGDPRYPGMVQKMERLQDCMNRLDQSTNAVVQEIRNAIAQRLLSDCEIRVCVVATRLEATSIVLDDLRLGNVAPSDRKACTVSDHVVRLSLKADSTPDAIEKGLSESNCLKKARGLWRDTFHLSLDWKKINLNWPPAKEDLNPFYKWCGDTICQAQLSQLKVGVPGGDIIELTGKDWFGAYCGWVNSFFGPIGLVGNDDARNIQALEILMSADESPPANIVEPILNGPSTELAAKRPALYKRLSHTKGVDKSKEIVKMYFLKMNPKEGELDLRNNDMNLALAAFN
jgi:hypothetical protein